MKKRSCANLLCATVAAVVAAIGIRAAQAHHSFAMYDEKKVYVFTGVVTRIKTRLREKHGIGHATVEIEVSDCAEGDCG